MTVSVTDRNCTRGNKILCRFFSTKFKTFWDAEDSCTQMTEAAGFSRTLAIVYQSTHTM